MCLREGQNIQSKNKGADYIDFLTACFDPFCLLSSVVGRTGQTQELPDAIGHNPDMGK